MLLSASMPNPVRDEIFCKNTLMCDCSRLMDLKNRYLFHKNNSFKIYGFLALIYGIFHIYA